MSYTTKLPFNNDFVEVEYSATKGYSATMWEPGCDDECEVTKVIYEGVDISAIISESDWEKFEIMILEGKDDEY